MVQIPIVSGIYADVSPDFRVGYPINMRPVPKEQGISKGYLRTVDGLRLQGEATQGLSRGGISWNGTLYRVFGTKLCTVSATGVITEIGDVGAGGPVSMDYSFDRLAIGSGGDLYYLQSSALTKVTDSDLGRVNNVVWVDGYFVTTDGEYIVSTELNDPASVDPLKYGSSEVDPDPVMAIRKVRNQLFAVNRHTVETFGNVGGSGFPFQVIRGAQSQKGAIGVNASAVMGNGIALLGGGRNDDIAVYICVNGGHTKISDQQIDDVLAEYSENELANSVLEVVESRNHNTLMIHLPDKTLCFDATASEVAGRLVWFILAGGADANQKYLGRFFVFHDGRWTATDPQSGRFGYVDHQSALQWGDPAGWKFGTPIIYNNARGGIIHSLELVSLISHTEGTAPVIMAQWSDDGVTLSNPKAVTTGGMGARDTRLRWLREGMFRQRRMYFFRGDGNTPISVAALEAEIEGLGW